MKKVVLFVLALILLSAITNAGEPENIFLKKQKQGGENGTCFDEGTKLINLGVGFFGGSYYSRRLGGGYDYVSSPAINISYEQAYPKKLGPGYLGVGAYLGFKTARSRYNNYYYGGNQYYYEHRWNYFMIAARAVYHWDVLNSKNAELYGGAVVGFRITTYNYSTNSTDPNKDAQKLNNSAVWPVGSVFAGARWYFAQNFALYGEVGYGVSILSGGITFKL
jgi:hypothetical protein